jgi:rRNA-processing protein FCF1
MPYDAFTIDTNAIIQGGMNFEAGLLAQLDQFKDGPIQFVVSEIVVRETPKHLNVTTKKARDAARSALDRAAQLGLISSDAAKTAVDALADSRTVARSKVASFLEATGAETVPANLCAIDALLKSYFDMRWRASLDEQLGKCRQHVFMLELTRNDERQTFPAGLVDDGEDAELAPVVGPPFDKVVGPYVSGIQRPQPDTGAIV